MNLGQKTAARKSLPLTSRDLADLATINSSPTHRAALSALVDSEVGVSEAALLHAVFEAGMLAVRRQIEEQGYAQLAADMDKTQNQRAARRRSPSWAGE